MKIIRIDANNAAFGSTRVRVNIYNVAFPSCIGSGVVTRQWLHQ